MIPIRVLLALVVTLFIVWTLFPAPSPIQSLDEYHVQQSLKNLNLNLCENKRYAKFHLNKNTLEVLKYLPFNQLDERQLKHYLEVVLGPGNSKIKDLFLTGSMLYKTAEMGMTDQMIEFFGMKDESSRFFLKNLHLYINAYTCISEGGFIHQYIKDYHYISDDWIDELVALLNYDFGYLDFLNRKIMITLGMVDPPSYKPAFSDIIPKANFSLSKLKDILEKKVGSWYSDPLITSYNTSFLLHVGNEIILGSQYIHPNLKKPLLEILPQLLHNLTVVPHLYSPFEAILDKVGSDSTNDEQLLESFLLKRKYMTQFLDLLFSPSPKDSFKRKWDLVLLFQEDVTNIKLLLDFNTSISSIFAQQLQDKGISIHTDPTRFSLPNIDSEVRSASIFHLPLPHLRKELLSRVPPVFQSLPLFQEMTQQSLLEWITSGVTPLQRIIFMELIGSVYEDIDAQQ